MDNERRLAERGESFLRDIGLSLPEFLGLMGKYKSHVLNLGEDQYKKFAEIYKKIEDKDYEEKEKGKLLEELTYVLFQKGYPTLVECRKNCRTSTNEIDLQLGWTEEARVIGIQNAFSFLEDFFICECKNYEKKVDVTYVGKFYSLLSVTRTNIGIMIAWDGITGRSSWNDSKGLIKKIALKEKIYILSIDKKDLEKIYNKKSNIFSILRDKYLALKNEIDYSKYIEKHEAEELMKEHSN